MRDARTNHKRSVHVHIHLYILHKKDLLIIQSIKTVTVKLECQTLESAIRILESVSGRKARENMSKIK